MRLSESRLIFCQINYPSGWLRLITPAPESESPVPAPGPAPAPAPILKSMEKPRPRIEVRTRRHLASRSSCRDLTVLGCHVESFSRRMCAGLQMCPRCAPAPEKPRIEVRIRRHPRSRLLNCGLGSASSSGSGSGSGSGCEWEKFRERRERRPQRIPRRPRMRRLNCGCRCVTPSWRWGKRGKFALAKITTSTLDPGHDAINKVVPPFVFLVPLHVTLFSECALQASHRTNYRTAKHGDYGVGSLKPIFPSLVLLK